MQFLFQREGGEKKNKNKKKRKKKKRGEQGMFKDMTYAENMVLSAIGKW